MRYGRVSFSCRSSGSRKYTLNTALSKHCTNQTTKLQIPPRRRRARARDYIGRKTQMRVPLLTQTKQSIPTRASGPPNRSKDSRPHSHRRFFIRYKLRPTAPGLKRGGPQKDKEVSRWVGNYAEDDSITIARSEAQMGACAQFTAGEANVARRPLGKTTRRGLHSLKSRQHIIGLERARAPTARLLLPAFMDS